MTTNQLFGKVVKAALEILPDSEVEMTQEVVSTTPQRYILVVCRGTTSEENKTLSKNFNNIVLYHSELNNGHFDLNSMQFDLLIIDASNKANHTFLEVVSAQAKNANIPIIVLKKSLTNYEELVEALDASVIKSVEDFSKKDFLLFLTKNKVPKLAGRLKHCLKALFSLLSKQ